MALALYRRYRPDTLDGVIGQPQVTIPLARALDSGRITQAYLFSGPRGTGKTSTARILARCLNCVKGPTSHPCGKCPSCRDLATGGPGSVDVVEIDAASHNGVDDARQIRERAQFAPTRDRYKIFILDEAHMVTPQGFNALLKIVEEPPEHVVFIFATTEPDKVISTIRSRTHHYPFRLVPPEILGPYVSSICEKEKITLAKGVLPLVLRAGGGSVRDTLSVLDQLMVGSKGGRVELSSATSLLGYTPREMISGMVDALISRDGAKVYDTVEKVAIGGFEPRRFIEDLLERFRNLIMVSLAGEKALKEAGEQEDPDQVHSLKRQAAALPLPVLIRLADASDAALPAMAAATSPRMKLELLAARLLEIEEEQARRERSARGQAPAPAAGLPKKLASPTAAPPAQGQVPPARPAGRRPPTAHPAEAHQYPAPSKSAVSLKRPAPPAPASPEAGWQRVLASLDEEVRSYVAPPRVAVDFRRNRAGAPHLVFTFAKPVYQHAFALALTHGRRVTLVVLSAVRSVFGPKATIAPAATAANGQRVHTMRSMSPAEQTKIKQQVALLTASKALGGSAFSPAVRKGFATPAQTKPAHRGPAAPPAAAESRGQGDAREGSTPKEKGATQGGDSGAGVGASPGPQKNSRPAPALEENGFAAPNPQQEREEAQLGRKSVHRKKHIAVPDAHDTRDPWASPQAKPDDPPAEARSPRPAPAAPARRPPVSSHTLSRRPPVPLAGGPKPIPPQSTQALDTLKPGQLVSIGKLAQVFAAKKVTTTRAEKRGEDVHLHAEIRFGKKSGGRNGGKPQAEKRSPR